MVDFLVNSLGGSLARVNIIVVSSIGVDALAEVNINALPVLVTVGITMPASLGNELLFW